MILSFCENSYVCGTVLGSIEPYFEWN